MNNWAMPYKIKSILFAVVRRLQTNKAFACRKVLTHGDDFHLGARTWIWAASHVTMGNQVYVGKDVHIEANYRIGDYCLIANRVAIIGRHDHDFTAVGFPVRFSPWVGSKRFQSQYENEETVIGDDVWLGFGSIVLSGVSIAQGSVIATRSIATRDVPLYLISAGAPAKVIGQCFSERGYDCCLIEPQL